MLRMAENFGGKRDEVIGSMIQTARKPHSQKWLADEMRDRGHKWSQATVWAVEKGVQPLRVTEAVDLAEVLGISFAEFSADSSDVAYIRRLAAETQTARATAVDAVSEWMFVQAGLDYKFKDIAEVLDDQLLAHLKAQIMRELVVSAEDLLSEAEVDFHVKNDFRKDDMVY